MFKVSLVLSFQRKNTPVFSTKFLVINSKFSRTRVENASYPSFPQKIPRVNLENSPPFFRAVKRTMPIFHSFHSPYYYYDKSFLFLLYFFKIHGKR